MGRNRMPCTPSRRHCASTFSPRKYLKSRQLARAAHLAVELLETRQLLSGSSATLSLAGAPAVNEHAPYAVTVSAGTGVDLSTLSINWGDGMTSIGPAATTHVYDDGPSDYAITATAQTTTGRGGG